MKLIYNAADADSVEAEAGAVTKPESISDREESPIEEKSIEREASYNSTGMN